MEQPEVVMYARFGVDVEQEHVDLIKVKMDNFMEMINGKMVGQCWEVLAPGQSSSKIHDIIKKCSKNEWDILTYDLKTLHECHSGALSLVEEGAEVGVPIFFIESKSVMKSIFGRL